MRKIRGRCGILEVDAADAVTRCLVRPLPTAYRLPTSFRHHTSGKDVVVVFLHLFLTLVVSVKTFLRHYVSLQLHRTFSI